MKYTNKLPLFLCLGMSCIILWGFSACDFQPTKELLYGRPVGGSLAGGSTNGTEFIEDGGSSGGLSKNLLHSGDLTLPPLSKHEIRTGLEDTSQSKLPNKVMKKPPTYVANEGWDPGEVEPAALNLAVNRINFLRRVSGLYPMTALDDYHKSAQYGAALGAYTQIFGHGDQDTDAEKIDGLDPDIVQKGTEATEGGNVVNYGPQDLIHAIDSYFCEPGVPQVGHRLLLLDPTWEKVGIGTAPAPDTDGKGFNVTQVYNLPSLPADHKSKQFDWNFVSYPASGYFPLHGRLFGSPASWSIKLNTNHYAKIGDKANEVPAKDVAVSLIRTSDGATWKFFIDDDTEILNIKNTRIYNCDPGHFILGGDTIIFRILKENPEHPGDPNKRIDHPYKDGEIYQVQVHGLKDKSGNPVDFAFETKFFTP